MQSIVRYSVTEDGTIVQFEAQISQESARLDPVFAHPLNHDRLIGQNLFLFIDGAEVCQLYAMLHKRVLKAARPISFDYRCDGPEVRREMRMLLSSEGNLVRYESVVLRETRRRVPIPNGSAQEAVFVVVCSMCNKYRYPSRSLEWKEIDRLLGELGLPERFRFTHGLCSQCFTRCMEEAWT